MGPTTDRPAPAGGDCGVDSHGLEEERRPVSEKGAEAKKGAGPAGPEAVVEGGADRCTQD